MQVLSMNTGHCSSHARTHTENIDSAHSFFHTHPHFPGYLKTDIP